MTVHGKQSEQMSEYSASAAPRPRRGGTVSNLSQPLSTMGASPGISPAFFDERSARVRYQTGMNRPGRGFALLMCVPVDKQVGS